MSELISIIIPCYNSAKTLPRTLNSIREQDYKDLEVLLINDGSKDNTLEVAESFAKIDKRIKIINQENAGVSVARNHGLQVARGNLIMFMDSDDNYTNGYAISKMYNKMKETGADQVICNFTHPCFERYTKDATFNLADRNELVVFYQDFFLHSMPWNKLTRRECITEDFLPGIKFTEDALFNLANFKNLKKVVAMNDVLYNYYCAPRNPNEPPSAINAIYAQDRFWEKKTSAWFLDKNMQVYRDMYYDKFYADIKGSLRYARSFDFLIYDMFIMFVNEVKMEHIAKVVESVFQDDFFKEVLKYKESCGLKLKTITPKMYKDFAEFTYKAFNDIKKYNRKVSLDIVAFTIFARTFFDLGKNFNTSDILVKSYVDFKKNSSAEAIYVRSLIDADSMRGLEHDYHTLFGVEHNFNMLYGVPKKA